jgi:hypothetical protein
MYKECDFFKEAVYYLIYSTTPSATAVKGAKDGYYQLFPFADDETYSGYPNAGDSDYGDFMSAVCAEWADVAVAQHARHWLNTVEPKVSPYVSAVDAGGNDQDFSKLPLDYYAPGHGFLYARNRWTSDATSLLFQLGSWCPEARHEHYDAGTFQIWRNGRWLSKESTGYSMQFNGGDVANTNAHNGILFENKGLAAAYVDGPAQVLRVHSNSIFAYAAVDLSKQYRAHKSTHPDRDDNPFVSHVEREYLFLRPMECLVILDRLEATNEKKPGANVTKTFVMHFPESPKTDEADRLLAVNGDQALRVITLAPKGCKRQVVDEGAFQGTHLAAPYYQFRLEESHTEPKQSYSLHVLQSRDAHGADIETKLTEDETSWKIQLDDPKKGHAVVEFFKGTTSKGGSVGFSANGPPTEMTQLLDHVQAIKVTDDGPIWGAER